MKVAVVGAGYVGLVSAVCLAKIGHDVLCVDRDSSKVSTLRNGTVPFFEPQLENLLQDEVKAKRLAFDTDTTEATRASNVVIIAVGTPSNGEDASHNLSFIDMAVEDIAPGINSFKVIVVKSTVPAGTTRRLAASVRRLEPAADFEIASNPEFLREGSAIFDFMNPDRIVIGTETPRAHAALDELYHYFSERNCAFVRTGLESAELAKLASNGMLAARIAFINELAELCETVGANIQDVARSMGLDERIGPRFLNAGPGFGGSCFPKDTKALVALGKENKVPMRLAEAVVESNERTKLRMVQKIELVAGGSLGGMRIAVFGVTFKPDTDDMRDAPSIPILSRLLENGAILRIVDPQGQKKGKAHFPNALWFDDPYAAAAGTDLIIVLTEWTLFRTLDLPALAQSMNEPRIADLRNIYNPEALRKAGFAAVSQVGIANRDAGLQ